MFSLYADKNRLIVNEKEIVTSGSVNVYTCQFEFSDDWNGMTRTAVFKAGEESRSVLLTQTLTDNENDKDTDSRNGNEDIDSDNTIYTCTIPWEVLLSHGRQLNVGVYGVQDGVTVLPTIWASLGTIKEGTTVSAEQSEPPTPDLWEQELASKGDGLLFNYPELSLMSGDKRLSTVLIPGGGGGGSGEPILYQFGHGLKQDGLYVSVDAVSDFSGDNTLPMTAVGVQNIVGNIEAILDTI